MGSVKDPITAGRLYRPATFDRLGIGAWKVKGTFSVADLKHLIEQIEIRSKGPILAMTAGKYWEEAAKAGFQSSYLGMLDQDGNITDVETLIDRGDLSDIVVMSLAMTPDYLGPLTTESRDEYHRAIASGEITAYIADAECIFRLGFPLGSSTFKRLCTAAGVGDRYETVATYSDTVALLDEVRAIPGVFEMPEVKKVLEAAGLDRIPNPGYVMDQPVMNFDTKFCPAGDQPLTFKEAQESVSVDNLRWTAWLAELERNAIHQRDFDARYGIVCVDGKTEAMVVGGCPRFTDFANTIDENRLMVRYTAEGQNWLLPTNKELQRAVFRLLGVYAAKDEATRDWGDDWRDHLISGGYITRQQLDEATAESVRLMEQAVATVGNRLLGHNVFDARPIEEWAGDLLPYASLEEIAN